MYKHKMVIYPLRLYTNNTTFVASDVALKALKYLHEQKKKKKYVWKVYSLVRLCYN